ncbi:hypothetical protein GCM10009651_36020 [Microbacterium natoriense]|uniref:DNA cytosine methyltransferase n=1 Tax=Microbacterium natoriense TaxID=284570 RepID=UPI00338058FF
MRSGELFAGVGGLGMAVDEVFGSSPAWFAEFDAAPSKVLAHHFPDVPNYGDVTKIHNPPKVNILAGGFPCQDVSLAGRRRGLKDGTRSGLWSEFARLIDETKPDWVVIENVRGLLSADAAIDVEPCPLCVGDNPGHVLRALGAVLGDLAELGFDAEWTSIRAADIVAPHGRFRVFILAWPSSNTSSYEPKRRGGGGNLARSTRTGEVDCQQRKRDGHAIVHRSAADPTRKQLPIRTGEPGTWHRTGRRTSHLTLLPTPGAYDGERGGSQHPDKRRAGNHSVTIQDVTEHLTLMPTPRASRGGATTETMYRLGAERVDDERPQGQVVGDITNWGLYTAAISRWETVMGCVAPAPVRFDGKGGKARLNPELTEWMMGWPTGWVTDPAIGITRAEQLKACGNGVVPQQASAALHELLARPGVPRIENQ